MKRFLQVSVLLVTATLAGEAVSQESPNRDAADVVFAMHTAGDADALAEFARSLEPDPWIVVERLFARGKPDAAAAFAAASDNARFEGLSAYVATQRGKTRAPGLEAALTLAEGAATRDDPAVAAVEFGKARELLDEGHSAAAVLFDVSRGEELAKSGEREEARALLAPATAAAEKLGWLRCVADGHNGLAICAQDPLDLDSLEIEYSTVSALRERIGDDVGASQAYSNLAVTRTMTGNYASALPALERASELLGPYGEEPENAYTLAHLLMTQGTVHQRLGESANAVVALQRALRMMPSADEDASVAQILRDLTSAFLQLGDYETAMETQERLLVVELRRKDPVWIGQAHLLLGLIEFERGNWAAADVALTTGRKFMEDAKHDSGVLFADLTIARVLRGRGALAEAVAAFATNVGSLEKGGHITAVAFARSEYGEALSAKGEHDAALEVHVAGLEKARELGQTDNVVRNLTGIARAQLALGEPDESIDAAKAAIADQSALVRDAAADQAPRARARRSEVYDIGVRAALAANDVDALAFFVESGRAGALLETMRSRDAFRTAVVPRHLREESLRLRRARADAQQAVRDAFDEGQSRKIVREQIAAHRDAQSKERAVAAEIERGSRFGAAMLYPKAAALADAKAVLGKHDVLVLYRVLPDTAIALVVPGGEQPAQIVRLGSSDDMRQACSALLAIVGDRKRGEQTRTADARTALDAAVSGVRKIVVDPIGLEAQTRRVLISPDGPLAHVPFSVLLERPEIVFVPSGTALLALLSSKESGAESILAVGDPAYDQASHLARLPASRAEVEALPEPAVRLLGDDATLTGFREHLASSSRWRGVHFACHGLLDDDPWRSALALTPDEESDGRLSALDVVGMSVRADLVVLSACDSGRGTVLSGEGMVGLTHGFFGAGAQRVVVGLWEVDDAATQVFMANFYESWGKRNVSVAAALRDAQHAVRAHEKWQHPYFWAAWVQWGAPN